MVFTCHVEPKSCTVSSQSLYCHDCYKVEIDVCSKCTRALTLLSLLPRLMDPLVWSINSSQTTLSLSHTNTHTDASEEMELCEAREVSDLQKI